MATEQRSRPLVSIIIPMFDAERTIQRAIRSCLDQTISDLEVIVVDDCSSDSSADAVLEFVHKDPRVRLLKLQENRGPADARNFGIEASLGRWITFLDADDFFLSSRLATLIQVVEGEPPRTVAMDVFSGDKTSHATKVGVFTIDTLPGFGLSPMVSREHLEESGARFPPAVRYGEDTAFLFMLMSLEGSRLIRIPDRLYHYSRSEDSLSISPYRFRHLARAYSFLLDNYQLSHDVQERLRRSLEPLELEHAYEMAQVAVRRGRPVEFIRCLMRNPRVLILAAIRAPRAIQIRVKRMVTDG